MVSSKAMPILLQELRTCTLCVARLVDGVRPVSQLNALARILIAGQAPVTKLRKTSIPFDDASGECLRQWMGLAP